MDSFDVQSDCSTIDWIAIRNGSWFSSNRSCLHGRSFGRQVYDKRLFRLIITNFDQLILFSQDLLGHLFSTMRCT